MRKSINIIIYDSLDGKGCSAEHVERFSQFANFEVMPSNRQLFTKLGQSKGYWDHSAVCLVGFEACFDLSLNGHFTQSPFHQFLPDARKNRLWLLRLDILAAGLAPTGEDSGRH